MLCINNRLLLGSLALGLVAIAPGQSFVNGDFETGDFTGWSLNLTTDGATTLQTVDLFDIDGPGPLGTTNAGRFQVGHAAAGQPIAGMTITQAMTLSAGVTYTFQYDWASVCSLPAANSNADGGIFDIIVNGTSIANHSVGVIPGQSSIFGVLTGTFTAPTNGSYSVGAQLTRAFLPSSGVDERTDNFTVSAVPEPASMVALGLGLAALCRKRRK